ncbi:MAG: NUDIX hydrolase [Chloroflexi bacterium]|nr:NUDIX hydrolase [Chloroflexota bacterium]MCL5076016.1 NUDIX hydrolase [Chloroflexota bacterium]
MSKLKTVRAVSAGGVAFRQDGEIQIVLVGRNEPRTWGLPKGTPRQGESLEETALREVSEETGLVVRLLEPIGEIEYWFVLKGHRFHKTVYFFLMEVTGGDISRHDPEYDLVEWFSAQDALQQLTYANESGIVQRALELIGRYATGGIASRSSQ